MEHKLPSFSRRGARRAGWLVTATCFLGLSSCDFEKDLDLDLNGPRELFVEAYLEQDRPGLLLLTTTQGYFDSLSLPLIQEATASIASPDSGIQNFYNFTIQDTINHKIYNYLAFPTPLRDGQTISLTVKDSLGRIVMGQSKVLPVVPIDSINVTHSTNGDSTAYLTVWLTDPGGQEDHYRLLVNKDSLQAGASTSGQLQDNARNGKSIALRTGYSYKAGDTVFVRLFHIEKSYYDYLESLQDAQRSNGNPFAQPAALKSTVQGGKGVFTVLRYDQKELRVPMP